MKKVVLAAVVAGVLLGERGACFAAGQSSASFTIHSDVFTHNQVGLGAGSAAYQSSLSVGQFSVVGEQSSAAYRIPSGFQATLEGFDTDGDGIIDDLDTDDDGDGIADGIDARPYDTDADGENNLADSDDDNDGYTDIEEAVVAKTDPLDANSFLRFERILDDGDDRSLQWASADGVDYLVEYNDALADQRDWTELGMITGTNATASITDTNGVETRTYRVSIPY